MGNLKYLQFWSASRRRGSLQVAAGLLASEAAQMPPETGRCVLSTDEPATLLE